MKQTQTITRLGVNHTLEQMRNPLTNIVLCVDILAEGTTEEEKHAYYATIKHSVLKLELAIKEVCTFLKEQEIDAASEDEFITIKKL